MTAPVEAYVAARLRDSGDLVRIEGIETTRIYRRSPSQQELDELPPHLREEVLQHGIEETDVQYFPGTSSVQIGKDGIVRIQLQFTAGPDAAASISRATLVVESSEWETIEAPVLIVIGPGTVEPTVTPDRIRAALAPGEASHPFVTIFGAPRSGSVIAHVANGAGVIRVQYLIAMKNVRRDLTPEEIEQLPPNPSIREELIRAGVVELVETGRSDGMQPLAVNGGEMVQALLRFTAPRTGFPNITESTLIIDSPDWRRKEIPLRLTIGRIGVEVVSNPVTVSQGGTAEMVVSVMSWEGPGDVVHFSLDGDGGRLRIAPDTLQVSPRQRASARLTLSASNDAPIGAMSATFVARVFEQLQQYRVPILINVVPGGLQVGTRPWSIAARQGETVPFEVFANSEGPARHLAFTPGALPRGVRCDPAEFDVGPGHASRIQPMRFVIDRDAPIVEKAYTPILWSVNGGSSHSGVLNLPLTINLNPEERVFRRDITTPSGTALGGFAEIVLRNDGSYIFRGHLHDSGFDPYAFRISVTVRSSTGSVSLAAFKSGSVAGTIGSGSRDFDWSDPGTSDLIRATWPQLREGTADFVFWYEDNGVLGTLEDLTVILGEFLVGAVVASPGIAAIIVIGSELGRLTDIPFAHPSLLAGVAVMGGVYMLLGPGMLLPAAVVGAIAGAQLQTRRLRPSEIAEAVKVFGDTLPIDRILVTNLSRGHHAFCIPHIDGSILMGLGGVNDGQTDRFDDPMKHLEWRATLIHELVHAWQIEHSTTLADMALSAAVNECRKLVGDSPYDVPTSFDGRPWSKFGFEQQAQIVENWYSVAAALAGLSTPPSPTLDSPGALNRWEFPYIQNNIRLGQT